MQPTELWPAHVRGRVHTLLAAAQRLAEVRVHRLGEDEARRAYERAHDAIYGVNLPKWERLLILGNAEAVATGDLHTSSCHICREALMASFVDYRRTGHFTMRIPLHLLRVPADAGLEGA